MPASTIRPGNDDAVVVARPLTPHCAQLLRSGEHACIGISPFNSYFTQAQIRRLARWAFETFSEVHFFVPDAAAAHTLQALGYPPARAATKARRQGKYLINKVCRALTDLAVADPRRLVLDCATLAANPRYDELFTQARCRFRGDPEFAAECLDAARWALDNRLPDGIEPSRDQLCTAVRYFIAELPLFVDTAGIVGTTGSVFCYHQSVPFLCRLYRRESSWHPTDRQGFVVVEQCSS